MKRLFICLTCFLFLVSCSGKTDRIYPTDNAYHFKTDSQYTWFVQGQSRNFAEAEDGYYFSLMVNGYSYLFFTEKETMQTVPVCNKPNCLHYEEMDEERIELCDARFSGLSLENGVVFYSNGRLYIITDNNKGSDRFGLTEVSKDGSSRKELFTFPDPSVPCNVAIHRGKLYAAISKFDENQNSTFGIWAYSLDRPNKEPELIYQNTSENIDYITDVKLFGNYLYFSKPNPVVLGGYWHYQVDLNTKEVNRVFEYDDSILDEDIYNLQFFDNQLIIERYKLEESVLTGEQRCHPYIADLEGKNVKEWIEVIHGPFGADENYFYRWPAWAGGKLRAVEPTLQIYNREGEMLVNYDMTGELTKFREVFISPGEHVFLYMPQKIYYFSKSEIPSGTITPKVLIDLTDSVRY